MEKFLVKIAGEGFELTMQASGEKAKVLGAAKKYFAGANVTVQSFGEEVDMSGK